MANLLVDDALWSVIEPLLPKPKPRRRRHPGRKPLPPRQALTGILFVLKSGIPWRMLPKEMGCGSGHSCWRYLRAWQRRSWLAKREISMTERRAAVGRSGRCG